MAVSVRFCQPRVLGTLCHDRITEGSMESIHTVQFQKKPGTSFLSTLPWTHGYPYRGRLALRCHAINGSDDERDRETGDEKLQGILVDMIRVQSDRVRVNDLVEEKTRLLNGIAEGAKEEYQRIAEETLTNIDMAGNRVMEQMEADTLKLEEELASAREQMEQEDRDFEEFEKQVQQARSRGLFFKSLYGKPVSTSSLSSKERETMKEIQRAVSTNRNNAAASKTRKLLYRILLFLVSLVLVDLALVEEKDWPKLALYSILCLALIAQLVYEKTLTSDKK